MMSNPKSGVELYFLLFKVQFRAGTDVPTLSQGRALFLVKGAGAVQGQLRGGHL